MLKNAMQLLLKGNIQCNNIELLNRNQGYFLFQSKKMSPEWKRDSTREWKKYVVAKREKQSSKGMEKVDIQRWWYLQDVRDQGLGLDSALGPPSSGAMGWGSWSYFCFRERLSLCHPAPPHFCGLSSTFLCFEWLPYPWPTWQIKLCT